MKNLTVRQSHAGGTSPDGIKHTPGEVSSPGVCKRKQVLMALRRLPERLFHRWLPEGLNDEAIKAG